MRTDRILLIDILEGHPKSKTSTMINDVTPPQVLPAAGFTDIREIAMPSLSAINAAYIAMKEKEQPSHTKSKIVHLIAFEDLSDAGQSVLQGLEQSGWMIIIEKFPFKGTGYDGTILILDDLRLPLLSHIQQWQWATLQKLINSHNKILWLTEGSQFKVTKPENAQVHGLVRTIRDEDPGINVTTLDVEDSTGKNAVPTCNKILEYLRTSTFQKTGDYEFVERDGKIYIGRIVQDNAVDSFSKAEREGAAPVNRLLNNSDSPIRMICERVGNLDSLHYHDICSPKKDLLEGQVEIEVFAAGLNFKDIAISTGLIPGNERLLGFEGAGIIRHSRSEHFSPGQRVLYTKPGSFANRLIAEAELVHAIPDSLSFEEAATLGAVYPVAMYSLFNLANTRKCQRVLIHSAAGGLGIACIHLCLHIGAEIYATVGNDEKRQHLVETFDIPRSRIFYSRSSDFAAELLAGTNGEGVDVIINSLTGDLLEDSWNCIRDGGTMVELGKRDIIERNYLPMAPFARNVSFRSFDISHESVPPQVMSR